LIELGNPSAASDEPDTLSSFLSFADRQSRLEVIPFRHQFVMSRFNPSFKSILFLGFGFVKF
jgi:hypothetical protein